MFPSPPAQSQYSVLIRVRVRVGVGARVRVAVRACSPPVALLQVKFFSCCFNTSMNCLQNFEYFEYKHIVGKKIWRLRRRTVFSRDTCWWPIRHHYLSKPGGGGGVSHTRTRPGRPPPWEGFGHCSHQIQSGVPLWMQAQSHKRNFWSPGQASAKHGSLASQ